MSAHKNLCKYVCIHNISFLRMLLAFETRPITALHVAKVPRLPKCCQTYFIVVISTHNLCSVLCVCVCIDILMLDIVALRNSKWEGGGGRYLTTFLLRLSFHFLLCSFVIVTSKKGMRPQP